jgi:hypothetical protein
MSERNKPKKKASYSAKSRKKNDSSSLIKPRGKQKKRQLSPRKKPVVSNKQTNPLPKSLPSPLLPSITHPLPTLPSPQCLSKKKYKKKKTPINLSRKRIPESDPRTPVIRPLRGVRV